MILVRLLLVIDVCLVCFGYLLVFDCHGALFAGFWLIWVGYCVYYLRYLTLFQFFGYYFDLIYFAVIVGLGCACFCGFGCFVGLYLLCFVGLPTRLALLFGFWCYFAC